MADVKVAVIDPVIAYRQTRSADVGDNLLDGSGNPLGIGPTGPIGPTGAAGADWGGIGGTLSNQADLQTALDAKLAATGPTGGVGTIVQEYAAAPSGPASGFLWIQAKDASTKTLSYFDGAATYSVDLSR